MAVAASSLRLIWNSSDTARTRKQEVHVGLGAGWARAREYENAVEWLCDAGRLTRVRLNAAHGIPLAAYDD